MKDMPTLETDAACGYASYWDKLQGVLRDEVPADFARKLERERDDARRHAASYEAMLNIARENAEEWKADCAKLREAILYTLEVNRHLADGDDCTLAKLKSAIPEWK